MTGQYAPFDMPVTVGLIPLLFQNGVWMNDAIVGAAVTIPARNSPALDWSNFDVTFFTGFDQLNTPAFGNDTSSDVFGATTFIEAKGGYIEAGYAYVDDPSIANSGYNNVGLSYTRRYLNLVSNSMRVIVNSGQGGPESDRTADGVLLLAENSFLTPWQYNVIPYVNTFAGFNRPQSVARAGVGRRRAVQHRHLVRVGRTHRLSDTRRNRQQHVRSGNGRRFAVAELSRSIDSRDSRAAGDGRCGLTRGTGKSVWYQCEVSNSDLELHACCGST